MQDPRRSCVNNNPKQSAESVLPSSDQREYVKEFPYFIVLPSSHEWFSRNVKTLSVGSDATK